jgi:hypothetical protein
MKPEGVLHHHHHHHHHHHRQISLLLAITFLRSFLQVVSDFNFFGFRNNKILQSKMQPPPPRLPASRVHYRVRKAGTDQGSSGGNVPDSHLAGV